MKTPKRLLSKKFVAAALTLFTLIGLLAPQQVLSKTNVGPYEVIIYTHKNFVGQSRVFKISQEQRHKLVPLLPEPLEGIGSMRIGSEVAVMVFDSPNFADALVPKESLPAYQGKGGISWQKMKETSKLKLLSIPPKIYKGKKADGPRRTIQTSDKKIFTGSVSNVAFSHHEIGGLFPSAKPSFIIFKVNRGAGHPMGIYLSSYKKHTDSRPPRLYGKFYPLPENQQITFFEYADVIYSQPPSSSELKKPIGSIKKTLSYNHHKCNLVSIWTGRMPIDSLQVTLFEKKNFKGKEIKFPGQGSGKVHYVPEEYGMKKGIWSLKMSLDKNIDSDFAARARAPVATTTAKADPDHVMVEIEPDHSHVSVGKTIPAKIGSTAQTSKVGQITMADIGKQKVIDISGKWNSNVGKVYHIIQHDKQFRWVVENQNETAEGTINGNTINATWQINGVPGSGSANITQVDVAGRAIRMEAASGVVLYREAIAIAPDTDKMQIGQVKGSLAPAATPIHLPNPSQGQAKAGDKNIKLDPGLDGTFISGMPKQDQIIAFRTIKQAGQKITFEVDYYLTPVHGKILYVGGWLYDNNNAFGGYNASVLPNTGYGKVRFFLNLDTSIRTSTDVEFFIWEPQKKPCAKQRFTLGHKWNPASQLVPNSRTLRPLRGRIVPAVIDISGKWLSSIGKVYHFKQNGNKFTWTVENSNETAQGTIKGKTVDVTWQINGVPGSATIKVTQVDSENRATRIEAATGIYLYRAANTP